MEVSLVGAKLFHGDWGTDRHDGANTVEPLINEHLQ
jgi:hypothetical protein